MRQVRVKKANASEPLMKCRNVSDDAKTEVCFCPRDEPGGDLLTAQVVSAEVAARGSPPAAAGTRKPVALKATVGLGSDPPDRPRENLK